MRCTVGLLVAAVAGAICAASAAPFDEDGDGAYDDFVPHSVGGEPTHEFNRPAHTALLQFKKLNEPLRNSVRCSGVRLNGDWLLTAAECLRMPEREEVRIVFTQDRQFKNKYYKVKKRSGNIFNKELVYNIHKNFDPKTKANNLAMVRFESFAHVDASTFPKLPYLVQDKNKTYAGQPALVTSFESVQDDEQMYVGKLNVTVLKTADCSDLLSSQPDKDNYICASVHGNAKLTSDDIGSPLELKDTFRYGRERKTLIGIATSIKSPDVQGKPQRALFTRVHPYIEWISYIAHLEVKLDENSDD